MKYTIKAFRVKYSVDMGTAFGCDVSAILDLLLAMPKIFLGTLVVLKLKVYL